LIRKMGASKTPSWGYRCCYCDSRVASGGNMPRDQGRQPRISPEFELTISTKTQAALPLSFCFPSSIARSTRFGMSPRLDYCVLKSLACTWPHALATLSFLFCDFFSSCYSYRCTFPGFEIRVYLTLLHPTMPCGGLDQVQIPLANPFCLN